MFTKKERTIEDEKFIEEFFEKEREMVNERFCYLDDFMKNLIFENIKRFEMPLHETTFYKRYDEMKLVSSRNRTLFIVILDKENMPEDKNNRYYKVVEYDKKGKAFSVKQVELQVHEIKIKI